MRKMLIALTTLAFCGVALASSGPLLKYVGNKTAHFAPQKQGHGGPGNVSAEFTSADTGINSSGFVYVTFKDNVGKSSAGLYQQYTFTASSAANWVCATGGGGKGKNQVANAPQTTIETSYTTFPSYPVGNNGTVSGGTAIPPAPEPTAACSGSWELGAVSYTLSSGALTNTTGEYNADSVMTGSCTIGVKCSKVYIAGVQAP